MIKYVVGVGCRRGVSEIKILEAISCVLKDLSLTFEQVKYIATCDVKQDEIGLTEFAKSKGLIIKYYSSDDLNKIEVPNPSRKPFNAIGTSSVAEAAALKGSGGTLISEKLKFFGLITIAVAKCSN